MRERDGGHLLICTHPATVIFYGVPLLHVKSMSLPAPRHHDNMIP